MNKQEARKQFEIEHIATTRGKSVADVKRAMDINEEIAFKWEQIAISVYSNHSSLNVTMKELKETRNKLFETAKIAGWTEVHSFLIPTLTEWIQGR